MTDGIDFIILKRNKKGTVINIKKTMKLKDEVGMAGSNFKKYTKRICSDNHIHYTSLHLLFE